MEAKIFMAKENLSYFRECIFTFLNLDWLLLCWGAQQSILRSKKFHIFCWCILHSGYKKNQETQAYSCEISWKFWGYGWVVNILIFTNISNILLTCHQHVNVLEKYLAFCSLLTNLHYDFKLHHILVYLLIFHSTRIHLGCVSCLSFFIFSL